MNARDLGASVPEAEDRLPAWAQQREEEAPNAEKAAGSSAEDGGLPDDVQAAPEEETEGAPVKVQARKEADEAWTREATRVEGGQYRWNRTPMPEETEEAPSKAKKGGKKKNKKNNRKKKNASKAEEKRGFVKLMAIVLICGVLFLMVAAMIMSNFIPSLAILTVPRRIITGLIAPVQNVFSDLTDSVAAYLRTLKIRGNLEYE